MDLPRHPVGAEVVSDLLAQVVRLRGRGFIYAPVWREEGRYLTCLYYADDGSSCLVGEVLRALEVPTPVLQQFADEGIRELWLAGRLPLPLSFAPVLLLSRAQRAQDAGLPWGEVLDGALGGAHEVRGRVTAGRG